MLLKLVKLQLTPPKLKFLWAGLLKAELNKWDSILSCACHFLEMLHFPEMPNGIQNQLKKVDCQLLGRHGKTLYKVQANQCPKEKNKARITKQFAKERGRPTPDLLCKGTAIKQVSKVSYWPGQKEQSRLLWRRVQELKYSPVLRTECNTLKRHRVPGS